MRVGYLIVPLLGFLFAIGGLNGQQPTNDNRIPLYKCLVTIGSVTVDPQTIHATQKPNTVVVTVQVSVVGEIPRGAFVTVALGTAESEPVGNNVRYDDTKSLPLKTSPVVFKFKAHGSSNTVTGRLLVRADITAATRGVTVKDPMEITNSQTWLTTTVP